MKTLFYNIGMLVGIHEVNQPLRGYELANLPALSNAYLVVEDHKIHSFGCMKDLDELSYQNINTLDVAGGSLFPSWCDSHTHLVFAGSRETEFVDKIKEEIQITNIPESEKNNIIIKLNNLKNRLEI